MGLFIWIGACVAFLIAVEASQRPEDDCDEDSMAVYNMTFTALWSKSVFTKQYPLFRPHAQWSAVVGRSHARAYNLFAVGEQASSEVKDFAETGKSSELDADTQGMDGILDIFAGPAINRGVGTSTSNFFVNSYHPSVSVMSRIVPSPDWFVGVSGLDLCQDGSWIDHRSIDLQPLDAGTDQGMTFTAPNWPIDPALPITTITSQEPHHPANSFYYPDLNRLPVIARLTLYKQSTFSLKGGEMGEEWIGQTDNVYYPEDDLQPAVPEPPPIVMAPPVPLPMGPPGGPVDCAVAEWAEWGSCSKTCGFGTRTRSRMILRKPQASGTPCPLLTEDELCGSMRGCAWKGFRYGSRGNGNRGKRGGSG